GRYIAFVSSQDDIVPNDTNNRDDVFLYDTETGQVERISVSNAGVQASADSFTVSISKDGNYVVFDSEAADLIPNEVAALHDIFLYDRRAKTL
ncbi:MAG TPA: hypothetical protein PLZ51_27315, partial [Aggregatilineales bacterium]|nr:hypothetical protein [Aggregatilineales bacterium]